MSNNKTNQEDGKHSRRKVLAAGMALAVAATPVAAISGATAKQAASAKAKMTNENQEAKALGLTKAKLPKDALAALPTQIEGIHADTKSRNKHPLVENSEPYILFEAMPKGVRSW